MRGKRWVVLATVAAMTVAGLLGFGAFLFSGVYPIAADRPHLPFVQGILTMLQERSVSRAASGIEAPSLDDEGLLRTGAALYSTECAPCHGAPGEAREVMGLGLNPTPPRLATEALEWSDAELYWIIAHGLKMAGMPGFRAGHTESQLWGLTAIVRRLPTLTPVEWQTMVAASRGEAAVPEEFAWIIEGRGERTLRAGDAARGRRLTEIYGCGSCHVIPGVKNAGGTVGPPLTDFGNRHYIAGNLLNSPENLTLWVLSPQSVEPGTAMPAVGVTPADAWDIAAYLLSLGSRRELGPPHPLPRDWLPKRAVVGSASAN